MSMLIFLAVIASAADPVADPMAPVKDGMLQCHAPDDAKKTCRSLASYKSRDDGSYLNDVTLLLMPEPVITLQTSSIVRVKGNAICGTLTDAQINTAKLFLDGRKLPPGRASPIRVEIGGAMASFIGKEICTSYVPRGGGLFTANATVDGVARPDLQQNVRWVRPEDGYRVAP